MNEENENAHPALKFLNNAVTIEHQLNLDMYNLIFDLIMRIEALEEELGNKEL